MPRMPKPWRRKGAGGAWYAQVRGVQEKLAGPEASFEEATRALYQVLACRKRDEGTPAPPLRADELCDRFMDHVKADLKASTYEWYRRHLKGFLAEHGATPAADVRPHHVADWANGQGWGPSNRRGAVTAVKAAFAWGRKMGYLEADPIRDLQKPAPGKRGRTLSGPQASMAIHMVSRAFSAFLEFLRETGARPGEGARLTRADVDFGRGLATLREHKTDGATSRPRLIALSARAREILMDQAEAHPTGPLFRNCKGRPWTRNAMSLAFRRLRAKTGMGKEATAHAMRHRFATDMAKTHPNTIVAALLGHKSTAMVDGVYSHLEDEVDALIDAVSGPRPAQK